MDCWQSTIELIWKALLVTPFVLLQLTDVVVDHNLKKSWQLKAFAVW